MLHQSSQLFGKAIGAVDGVLGQIHDVFFDDQTWKVRYVVVNTGTWLAEHLVLLRPTVFQRPPFGQRHGINQVLLANLTRQQVADSPPAHAHPTVSRQHSFDYPPQHGWSAIWARGGTWGVAGYPIFEPKETDAVDLSDDLTETDDLHLRSTKTLAGYRIRALDQMFGHVRAFLVDDAAWAIRSLIIEAGHWYASRTLSIPVSHVRSFNYQESSAHVDLTRAEILQPESPAAVENATRVAEQ